VTDGSSVPAAAAAEGFSRCVEDSPLGETRSASGAGFKGEPVSENIEEVDLKESAVVGGGRCCVEVVQVGGEEAVQSRGAHGLREETVGDLAGIPGIADTHKFPPYPGENGYRIGPPEAGESFLHHQLESDAGEDLQGAAEAMQALFPMAGDSTDLSMLAGEQCDDSIRLAIVHGGENDGFTRGCLHVGTVSRPGTGGQSIPVTRVGRLCGGILAQTQLFQEDSEVFIDRVTSFERGDHRLLPFSDQG